MAGESPKKRAKTSSSALNSAKASGADILEMLGRLMKHSKELQNNAPVQMPKEDLAAQEVIDFLKPFSEPEGPLIVKRCMYTPGRSNLIITYPASVKTDKVVSFVGCHMDVVPANPEQWERNPFELGVDGDKVFGRGVTDCLGHVATMACCMKTLVELQAELPVNVCLVLIANEENNCVQGVGIDGLMSHKELDHLKTGPLCWVDSANFGPTLATAGMTTWELTATGKLFHSGIPQRAINPINLAMKAVAYMQTRFYEDFYMGDNEKRYKFEVGSTLKPTQIKTPPGSINQIPKSCIVAGDIRLTPFVNPQEIKESVERYVEEFNKTLDTEKDFGYSTFSLPEEELRGKVELQWTSAQEMKAVACSMDSPSYHALEAAIKKVKGTVEPFSLTGSLPLIGDLQQLGYDVQITGFGRMEAYHAINEYAFISDFVKGSEIVFSVLATHCAAKEWPWIKE